VGYDIPPETLQLLRYGRGVDGSKLVDAGFRYRFTTAGAVEDFARALRLRSTVGAADPEYTYQADVEQFFKHSPAVVREQPPS
jgi:UDP-glucose 4-epimerase